MKMFDRLGEGVVALIRRFDQCVGKIIALMLRRGANNKRQGKC